MKKLSLKRRLSTGDITLGSWITLTSGDTAEIMAQSGFDWLAVDMEHSAITLDRAQELIRIIEANNTVPLVRVGENHPTLIKRVMDAGAYGVIVPMVNTEDDALQAVQSVKYPPAGQRGVGLARAQGYGMKFTHYKEWMNKESIVIVQIEHIKAVANLEKILTVKGVDGFIVGPYDLSASLGIPGEFNHADVKAACRKILEVSKRLKKPAGFHVIPPDSSALLEKAKEGYRFLGFSLDALYLKHFCSHQIEKVKSALKKKR